MTIVGICGDAKYDRVTKDVQATYYVPYRQHGDPDGGMGMTYEISTRMNPAAIVPSLRAAVAADDVTSFARRAHAATTDQLHYAARADLR